MIRQAIKMIWRKRSQNAFLSIEILLSFLILFAVFSLIGKQMSRYNQPLGFESEFVANSVLDLHAVRKSFVTNEETQEYDTTAYREMLARLKQDMLAVNGVEAVSYSTSVVPFNGSTWSSGNDGGDEKGEDFIVYDQAHMIITDENYNDVFQAETIEGQWFTEEDAEGTRPPVVINRKFVDLFIPDNEPVVGRVVEVWSTEYVITGVVEAFKYSGEFEEEHPMLMPYIGDHDMAQFLVFRFDESKNAGWEQDVQTTLERNLKDVTFFTYKLDDARWIQSRPVWVPIIGLLCLCAFLVINVAMGLFGALQYKIKKRRSEIGLRKIIGASGGRIRRQFLTEMLIIATLGLVVGVLLAVQVPFLNLFEVENSIFYTAILISLVFIYLVVTVCSLIPSSQAARIQPAIALHENG